MATYHIKKQSYKGYCVGECIEYPIILDAKTDEKLEQGFIKAIAVYEKSLKQKLIPAPRSTRKIKVLQIEQ